MARRSGFRIIIRYILPLIAATIALLNLLGWSSGSYRLLTPIDNYPVMTPATSALIILSALSFIFSTAICLIPAKQRPRLLQEWLGHGLLLLLVGGLVLNSLILPDLFFRTQALNPTWIAHDNLAHLIDGPSIYTMLILAAISGAALLENSITYWPVLLRNFCLFLAFAMQGTVLIFFLAGFNSYFGSQTRYETGISIYTWLAMACLFTSTAFTKRGTNYFYRAITYGSTASRSAIGLFTFLVLIPFILLLTNGLAQLLGETGPQRIIAAFVSAICLFLTLIAFYITHLIRVSEQKLLKELKEKQALIDELKKSIEKIESLRDSLVTVCAWSNAIKAGGEWQEIEEFLSRQLGLKISHGISPKEMEKQKKRLKMLTGRPLYPEQN